MDEFEQIEMKLFLKAFLLVAEILVVYIEG